MCAHSADYCGLLLELGRGEEDSGTVYLYIDVPLVGAKYGVLWPGSKQLIMPLLAFGEARVSEASLGIATMSIWWSVANSLKTPDTVCKTNEKIKGRKSKQLLFPLGLPSLV